MGLKTHPTNPTQGVESGKNAVLERENPCRVGHPTPTRQDPTGPDSPPACRVVSGGVGCLSGEVPDTHFCDEHGHKPPLEGGVSGLSGGFFGG